MLTCDELEAREMPAVAVLLAGGTLTISGTAGNDRITVYQSGPDLVVLDGTAEAFRTAAAGVTNIAIDGGGGNDSIRIAPSVTQPAAIDGGSGNNKLVA